MAVGRFNQSEVTPREWAAYEHEKQMLQLQIDSVRVAKGLELELARVEARWASWLRVPSLLLRLPFLIVAGLGLAVALARGIEPSDKVLNLFK